MDDALSNPNISVRNPLATGLKSSPKAILQLNLLLIIIKYNPDDKLIAFSF